MVPVTNASSSEKLPSSQETAPFDFQVLESQTLGNRPLQKELLEIFSHQADDVIDILESTDGVPDVVNLAHKIKGSASSVGAWRVAETALDIETCAFMGKQDYAEQTEELVGHLKEAVSFLEQHLKKF